MFNPTAAGTPTPATIDDSHAPPVRPAHWRANATAVNVAGQAVNLDPSAPARAELQPVIGADAFDAVACPCASLCDADDRVDSLVVGRPSAAGGPVWLITSPPSSIGRGAVAGVKLTGHRRVRQRHTVTRRVRRKPS
jgi:hypothetical protein